MSAPGPNGGASSSGSENPAPLTNGVTKTYPPPADRAPGMPESLWRWGIVTVTNTGTVPRMFQVQPYGDDQPDWPTEEGGRELDLKFEAGRDTGLVNGRIYHICFERPLGSPDTTPYKPGLTTGHHVAPQ